MKFDPNNHERIEIYDAKTQKKIEKIINKNQFYTDENNVKYVMVNAINGKGIASDAFSTIIISSYFNVERLTRWVTDLYLTRWIIFASILWNFILSTVFLLLSNL